MPDALLTRNSSRFFCALLQLEERRRPQCKRPHPKSIPEHPPLSTPSSLLFPQSPLLRALRHLRVPISPLRALRDLRVQPNPPHHPLCAHKTVAVRAHSQIFQNSFYPNTYNTLRQSKHPLTDRDRAHKPVRDPCIREHTCPSAPKAPKEPTHAHDPTLRAPPHVLQ